MGMKIGILGLGGIARATAPAMASVQGLECYAAASRSLQKAESFAKEFGFAKAYGSYEEMLADPQVELVYIATPHSHHYDHMKLCLEQGKHVLCEKAFTMNGKQARAIAALARQKGLYVAEAIWTRYMPSRKIISELLASGVIGKVNTLTANLSYVISQKQRLIDPNLAGGALLDVGVYGINFALMHFGADIERIETSVQMTPTGVDGNESITIFYKDGRMAVLTHGIYSRSDRKGIIYGDKGYLVVENINNPRCVSVYDTSDRLVQHIDMPKQVNGYEYEFAEAVACIGAGKTESSSMPLEDSVFVMDLMDGIRKQWGMVYPQEKAGTDL